MIVVTGAAGFIGSCVVASLNERGVEDLILVDHFEGDDDPKKKNIENKKYEHYYDKEEFLDSIEEHRFLHDVTCVIHMGACSSTTCDDEDYFERNNFQYTKRLAMWAVHSQARFIYASSAATYGDGSLGYKDDDETTLKCKPLNLYGESKQKADLWVLNRGLNDRMVGLKFFNVFGPNEYHKEDMRSVVCKAYEKVSTEGKMLLFKSYHPDYKDGEQKRDFIYVKDAVDVILYFMDHPEINGIYNVGTGQARTWNDLANALFASVNKEANIEYIEMPEVLKDKYQYFTQSDMDKLKQTGYTKEFTSLENAIKDYSNYLKEHSYL